MRIRSTKPEFWRSKTIAQLEWSDRFVLKGLEAYVDDNGVGKDDVELIASDVFPRDLARTPDTLARLSEAISRIFATGLIVRYTHDGERLIYIDKWKDIQRVDKPNRGRYPRPDGTLEYIDAVDRDSYRNPREGVAPGTEEQGNRGTGEQNPPTPRDESQAPQAQTARTKNGAEHARSQFAALPSRTAAAHQIAQAFSDSLPVPIETGTRTEIAVQIDKCLRDAIPPPAIAAGIRAWADSDSWHPSQIPKFVAKAAAKAASHRSGIGKPTEKARGYDQLAQELIEELEANT